MNRTDVPSGPEDATLEAWRTGETAALCDTTIDDWSNISGTDSDEVCFARHAVRLAGPRHPKEAATALTYCGRYAAWRTSRNLTLDVPCAFSDTDIDKYLDDALADSPTGTRNAVRSILRRLAPGVGLGRTTRTTTTSTTRVAQTTVTAMPLTVDETIGTYTPQMVDTTLFAAVAGIVQDAVRTARPATPKRACDLIRHASYLAAWAHTKQLPIRGDTIFAASTIEDFIDVVNPVWPASSVRTIAANLHHVREAIGVPLDVTRRSFTSDEPKEPFNQGDIDVFYTKARSIPSANRRRFVVTALDLVFGAGIAGVAVGSVRPGDITLANENVHVTYAAPGETRLERIRVLEAYTQSLRDAVVTATERGDQYMIGGTTSRRGRRCHSMFKPEDERFGLRIDMTRARLTWAYEAGKAMCEHAGGVDALRALLRNPTVIEALERDLS